MIFLIGFFVYFAKCNPKVMSVKIWEEKEFKFVDEGSGKVILLLHGLFGALSNWDGVVKKFSQNYRVIIPMLPIYSMPTRETDLDGLVQFLERFVAYKELDNFVLVGNSLGGHVGLLYTFQFQEKVSQLVLTGSSGLFENSRGGSFPKRGT